MPAGYFRGMRTGGGKTSVRSKYKEPKANNLKNWSGIRVFNGKRYTIHSVLTKEPTKAQLDSLKKEYNVRVVKEKHPKFGYRFIVMTSPWIGKYAE